MSEGRVRYHKDGGVGRIVFDNPDARNALNAAMWRELGEHCAAIANDPEVRAVTLRGAGGKAFISGNDIKDFLGFKSGDDGIAYENEVGAFVEAVERLPQPTIAVVEGWAVGGGLAIAFACDFRVATPGARFGSPIARTIGNCLSAKGYARLLAHVGPALTKRMLLLGEILSVEELAHLGLVHQIVDADEIDAAVDALAARLKENAPLTIRATKEAIRRINFSDLPDIDDLIRQVYGSRDFHEGVRNFIGKVKPSWSGK